MSHSAGYDVRVCDVVRTRSSCFTVVPTELTRDDNAKDTSTRTCQPCRDADASALPKIVHHVQKS